MYKIVIADNLPMPLRVSPVRVKASIFHIFKGIKATVDHLQYGVSITEWGSSFLRCFISLKARHVYVLSGQHFPLSNGCCPPAC